MPAGVGLPSSMYSDPPLASTSPRLWLPPKVWFQGSQSSSTGGSLARNGMDCRSIAALLQHMRLVVITALGWPVEPEVSRNLTMESASVREVGARLTGPCPLARFQRFQRSS